MLEELVWMFQREVLDFPTFPEVLETLKQCSQITFRGTNEDVMNAGFPQEIIDVETAGRISPLGLYKTDTVEIL